MRRLFVSALAVGLLSACASVTAKVPIVGPVPSVADLVGAWVGTYSSEATGRSGIIVFRLNAVDDTAEGSVHMDADPPRDNMGGSRYSVEKPPQPSIPLFIRFVVVKDGEVVGVLEPYKDPACGCTLTTTFYGRLDGEEIKGTFRSDGDGIHHLPANGNWSVTRIRK